MEERNSDRNIPDPASGEPLLAEAKEMEGNVRNRGRERNDDKDVEKEEYDITFTKVGWLNSLKSGVKNVLRNVTLEPMLFLKMVAEGNYGIVADTLEIDRICRVNLNYSEDECASMDDGNHTEVQVAVQRFQNLFNYNQNLMDSILPLLVVIFMGSLSDRHGRKPPMLGVLAGFVGVSLCYFMTALNTHWPVEVLYVGTFVVDMTGTWVVFNMAVYSYVADITTPENRTKRLGILDAVWYLGGPLGRLMGGWLYRAAGSGIVFAVSAGLWIVCFCYVLFLVRESVDTRREAGATSDADARDARFGPLRHVVSLVRTAFKRRPGLRRQFLLGLLAIKLLVFLTQGHQMYLWARRVLRWGPAEYSTWSSLESLEHQAGMVAWVAVASRFHLHDALVAIVGLLSLASWSVVLALITGPALWWLVIVASLVGSFEAAIEPALRTLLTVVVGEGEVGQVLALNGLLEAAWLTADRSLYTFLYNTFVEELPQINFIVQAGVSVLLVGVMFTLWYRLRRQAQREVPNSEIPVPSPTLHI